MFRSLRTRLNLLVLLSALPGFVVALLTSIEHWSNADTRIKNQFRHEGKSVVREYEDEVDDAKQALRLLVNSFNQDADQCSPMLSVLSKPSRQEYLNAGLINTKGQITCSSAPVVNADSFLSPAYLHKILTKKTTLIGKTQVGTFVTESTIVVARSFRLAGNIKKIAFLELNMKSFLNSLDRTHFPQGLEVRILDHTGNVLWSLPQDIKNADLPQKIIDSVFAVGNHAANSSTVRFSSDKSRIWSSVALPLNEGGGHLIMSVPQRAVFGHVWFELIRNVILIIVGMVVVFWILGLLSERWILRRAELIIDAAHRFAGGNWDARTGVWNSDDELGEIGKSFDSMAAQLQKRMIDNERQLLEIGRLNRIHQMFTATSNLLNRVSDMRELLNETCRIAVETGGFQMAWVAEYAPDTCEINLLALRPVTPIGDEIGVWPPHCAAQGDCLVARALLKGETVIEDYSHQSMGCTCLNQYNSQALCSGAVAIFPLNEDHQGKYYGLVLYASSRAFFAPEELDLLKQLASATGVALHIIETDSELYYTQSYERHTGLPNRVLLEDRLKFSLETAKQRKGIVSIVTIDVGFHTACRRLGMTAAYEMVAQAAQSIKQLARGGDIVGCLAGYEFVWVVTDLQDRNELNLLLQESLDRVSSTIFEPMVEIRTPLVRAGVSVYPYDGDTSEQLLSSSQFALSIGSGSEEAVVIAFFSKEINQRLLHYRKLSKALRNAICHDELSMHYQPIVDIASSKIVGFESLLRWNSATLGNISPGEFIPIAEEIGLVSNLGAWALRAVSRQALNWQRAGFSEITVAVNVSADQIRNEKFPDFVESVLSELEEPLVNVQLAMEITESMLITDMEETIAVLLRLKALGIKIYIDDFGTGYSSLSYLHRFPLDVLKIDRSFTRELDEDDQSLRIIQSIIALAHSLGMSVIAEGIETEEQLDIIRSLGCERVQGFLLGFPMVSEQATRLLFSDGCLKDENLKRFSNSLIDK